MKKSRKLNIKIKLVDT